MDKETQLTMLFMRLPVPCVLLKLGLGEILDANEAFKALFVPSGVDCIGKTTLDLQMWVNPAERQALMNELVANGEVSNISTSLVDKNGRLSRFIITAANIEDKYYVATIFDISEIEEQKTQYKKLLNKYQNIISLTGTAFVILDDKFIIQEANDKMGEIIGYSPIEIIGERFFGIISDMENHSKDKMAIEMSELLTSTEKSVFCMDICLKKKDGSKQWMSLNAGAFGYNKFVCFMNDISGKKNAEHSKFINTEKNKDKIRQRLSKFQQEIKSLGARAKKDQNGN